MAVLEWRALWDFGFLRCKGADRSSDRTDATHEDRFAGKLVGALAAASAQPKGRRLTQPLLQQANIIAAVDVKNPLLGENGATRVFGPQKGASKSRPR